jgi:plastocyanin
VQARHLLPFLAACLLLSVLPAATGTAQEGTTIIVAKSFMFAPAALTVKAGSTVTWTNHDQEPHTVASDSGLFRSNALDTNDSYSFRFDQPGTYHYTCSIHPQMVGTIIVQ